MIGRPRGSRSLRGEAARIPWSSPLWKRILVEFGLQLRKHREATDISAAELAEAVGVSPLTVFAWERGRSMPNGAVLFRVAAALSCSFVDLLPDELHERVTSL